MSILTFELVSLRPKTEAPLVAGPNLRNFLFNAAMIRRQTLKTRTAAITGSAGKTTVKEMLGSILKTWSQKNSKTTHISVANQNTKLALAAQILRLPENTSFAVFEIGARRQGDFQIPFSYVHPQVITLLNIGSAHAGEFGSLENLVREKLSVLELNNAEAVVVCGDDTRIITHAQKHQKNIITFGFAENSDVRILSETNDGVSLKVDAKTLWVTCDFSGPRKALNLAAAFATAKTLGFETSDILEGLKNFQGVERRFQVFSWQGKKAIDDAYNASPESMREGLQYLSSICQNQKVLLVIGSMLELGAYSEQEHRALGEFILKTFPTETPLLVTIGDEAAFVHEAVQGTVPASDLKHFATALEARPLVESMASTVDVIYFKGSKSIQLQKIFSKISR